MRCRICGNSNNNQRYRVREMMFGYGDEFVYLQCSRCKCLQIAEIPRDMSKYYPQSYYSFSLDPRVKYKNPIISWIRRLGDYYTVMNRSIPGKLISSTSPNKKLSPLSRLKLSKQSKILEVGCGTGWRLYALREAGFHNVLGADPYIHDPITYDSNLRILKTSIHDLEGANEWDLIMYHHSFEHVPDPLENLSSASRLLKPGGTCLVRIPTVSSYAWEHYREYWVQLDAPRHYFLHSMESIKIIADKAGLYLKDVIYDSINDQFQGSELYRKGIPLVSERAASMFTKSQVKKWKRQAKKLNAEKRGDQAAFYLIK